MEDRKKDFLYIAAIFLQKIATAVADILCLLLLAELIGEAIPCNGLTESAGRMTQYVLGLLLLSVWKRMGYNFGRILTRKLQNIIRFRMDCRIVEKTAKIPYRLLEDHVFCDLKQALQENIDGSSNRSFVWSLVQHSGNFMIYCVKTLGLCLLLGRASIPLGVLFFLLEVCHCLMTVLEMEQDTALVEAEQRSLKLRYMEELALGQTGAGERSLFAYAGYIGEKCDRETVTIRQKVFAHSLKYEKARLANRVLKSVTYVLAELALAALMIDGRIPFGYFIALSIGVWSLIEKNDDGNALYHLLQERYFWKQWNRFLNLPETEEGGENDEEKDGKWNGKRNSGKDRGKNKEKDKAAGGENGVKRDYGDNCVIQEFNTLEFRNVAFRYPRTGRYVLHDLSFKLTRGGYYAFVGANGSGKTTIVKLLSGLYDNYEGEIRLNGIELREIPFCERRRIFAVLFQDAAKYEDTIARNIFPQEERERVTGESGSKIPTDGRESEEGLHEKRGREQPDKLQLAEELVREWEADGRCRFPQGADTFLGSMEENGVILSAGEWKQLLIARELAQPAQIRVLDEPMASLDIFRQSKVYEQFTRDAESHTTLLFSHHMAAVRKAKRIFVLSEGTIVEEGSHDRLMSEKGLYARLYETQCEARRTGE